MNKLKKFNAFVKPHRDLLFLSPAEVEEIVSLFNSEKNELFRQTALAALNSGEKLENSLALSYPDFKIQVVPREQGIYLFLESAPAPAFVETASGIEIIKGIGEQLFAVLRDLLFIHRKEQEAQQKLKDCLQNSNCEQSVNVTEQIFAQLRNAGMLDYNLEPNLVVCWGGHTLLKPEYSYSKAVGYQLGVRGLDICTGSGTGAMQGPMKGAMIAHAKQRLAPARYLGITEPDIISVEAPNPLVNQLVIMADIEKRLEAFVRLAHALIVFPGGIGTLEEILYIASILMHEKNATLVFPLILTGPKSSSDHFKLIDEFLKLAFGDNLKGKYEIILEDENQVGSLMQQQIKQVAEQRKNSKNADYFNWNLYIPHQLQDEFLATHKEMQELDLSLNQKPYILAANLRKVLSGIVSANVRTEGKQLIKEKGLYKISGDLKLLQKLDELIDKFTQNGRMKLDNESYQKCYKIQGL